MKNSDHQRRKYKEDYAKSYNPIDPSTKSQFRVGDDVIICEENNSLISLRSLEEIDYLCPFCRKQLNADLIIVDFNNNLNKEDKPSKNKQPPLPPTPSRRPNAFSIYATAFSVFLGFCFIIAAVGFFAFTIGRLTPINLVATPTNVVTPASSPTLISTNTPAITSTPTPFPNEFTDDFGVAMRLIPDGEFTMGSNGGFKDERPIHIVYLDSYYIDKYEVTNALYEVCVNDGVCNPPQNFGSGTHSNYFGNTQYSNYPVIYVDWYQSKTYCEWRDARLPTEAEWEKAARSINEYNYPWGNNFRCENGNFDDIQGLDGSVIPGGPNCDGYEDTTPVGSFASGRSPFGIYDMAGNVWEWVSDWYDGNYYIDSSYQDPQGPLYGNTRVLRGGAWDVANEENLLTTRRIGFDPLTAGNFLGFRCASSLP
ncbi:MAG: SUMF1/EgtB/PvdO family nonheme iron enzyme [Sediminibacterium sp.]|nr:SUMF1/EgtB/PvdO family nonheme iron enzyme [Sediminibacterium sp.]